MQRIVGWLMSALVWAACVGGQEARPRPVLVLAAASLDGAFNEIGVAFADAHEEWRVELSFGGSTALADQVLEGAPADVYAAADTSGMIRLNEAGLVAGAPRAFARNLLMIAVPPGNPGRVTGLADFADPALLLGLCAPSVPCGRLAGEALARAGVSAAADTEEPDVRALLTKIESGELDAGIVYATDVLHSAGSVEGVEIPGEHNVETTYPIAALAGSPEPDGATAFVVFVLSPAGADIMARYGFAAP